VRGRRLAMAFIGLQIVVPAVVQVGYFFLGWDNVGYGWMMFATAP
jgi:hypothetical protein